MISVEHSYERQARSEAAMEWPSSYARPDSVDHWRHQRMLDSTGPLIEVRGGASWLTVGDGRYGSDAAHLLRRGVDATATSLTDERLAAASARGFIRAYRAENAEHMRLAENSFDFVLCKEAYHHFPRPPVALYEMLRIARIGVVLIEPLDERGPLNYLKDMFKKAIRGDRTVEFEPSGNYLYRIDPRELRKLLLSSGGGAIAVKKINDFYHPALARGSVRPASIAYRATQLGLAAQDVLCHLKLLGFGLAAVVLFKTAPGEDMVSALRRNGYAYEGLPKNPYSSADGS